MESFSIVKEKLSTAIEKLSTAIEKLSIAIEKLSIAELKPKSAMEGRCFAAFYGKPVKSQA
jgi:hypothetical protein